MDKSLIEFVFDPVIIFDKELKINNWNAAAEQQFGLAKRLVIGKKLFSILPNLENDLYTYIQEGVFKDNREIELQKLIIKMPKSQQELTFKIIIAPYNAKDLKNPCGIIFLKKLAFQKENTNDYFNLIDSVILNTRDAVMITKAEPIDGENNPKIIFANPAFYQMTGFAAHEILGKSPRILQGPKTSIATKKIIKDHLSKWKPIQIEILNYKKDGTEFWVDLSIVPIKNEEGWFTHWIAIQRDTTIRRELENQLKAYTEDLEKLVQERTIEIEQLHIATKKATEKELELKKQKLLIQEMQISEKAKLMQQITSRIDEILKSQEPKRELSQLRKYIVSQNIDQGDWKSFIAHFDDLHPEFFKRLDKISKSPLTSSLKKHCAFIKMNLSSKDVANILHIEPKSVDMARYRLKKQFDVKSNMTLFQFFQTI